MTTATQTIEEFANREYQHGFETLIEADTVPPGLNEDVIRVISAKKQEPAFLLEWRLKAYRHWLTMTEPKWPNVRYPPINYQDIIYYSAPKQQKGAEEPRRSRPRAAPHVRKARHLPGRTETAVRRRRRCGFRQRFRGDHLQGEARRDGHHLLLVLRSGAAPSRAGTQVPRLRRARTTTTSSPRSTRRSSATARSATSPRASAARWSCPPISASTPRTPASSSAR